MRYSIIVVLLSTGFFLQIDLADETHTIEKTDFAIMGNSVNDNWREEWGVIIQKVDLLLSQPNFKMQFITGWRMNPSDATY